MPAWWRDAFGQAKPFKLGTLQPLSGTAAAGGILAIDLARGGFRGPQNPLRGEFGLYQLYFRGEYDEAQLLGQLGERNEILNSSLKPYPTCKYTHHAIYTTLKLVEEHDLKPEQIKTAPPTPGAAQFSYPFTVASAIVRRRVSLEDFTEDAIRDPELLANAGKVTTRIDPAKDALPMLYPPADVTVETTDGR